MAFAKWKKFQSDYNSVIIFTKEILPVPIESEVLTHKVP